jgi:hypothetical protein
MTAMPAGAGIPDYYEVVFGPDERDRQAYTDPRDGSPLSESAGGRAARAFLGMVTEGVPCGLWLNGVLMAGTDTGNSRPRGSSGSRPAGRSSGPPDPRPERKELPMTAETPRPVSYRAYIDLISSRAGLAEAMLALQGRESSAITALRDTLADADPAEIDAALREVIRAAQKARKALKGDVA